MSVGTLEVVSVVRKELAADALRRQAERGSGFRATAIGALFAVAVSVATVILGTPVPSSALPYSPPLTRAPYLTDLVGLNATVNWATDRSYPNASAMWGAVDSSGSCMASSSVNAARTSITVNNVSEYQWAATLTMPSSGEYCYRVFLGSTDLLGADASPDSRPRSRSDRVHHSRSRCWVTGARSQRMAPTPTRAG